MAQKHTRPRPHAEFRHRSQVPMPAVEEVEQRLTDLLGPSFLAPRQFERRDPRQPQRLIRMRQRLLTLPVMAAIIVSLVWRQLPAVAEVQRVLAREGLLEGGALAGQFPGHPQTARRATGRDDGAALCGSLCAAPGPGAPPCATHTLGAGAGALPPDRHLWMARRWKHCAKKRRSCRNALGWSWGAR